MHPALDILILINNLKTASARNAKSQFADHFLQFFKKPLFWHSVYFVGGFGAATLDALRAYVDKQGTMVHTRKFEAKKLK